jgi:hypothetical protein
MIGYGELRVMRGGGGAKQASTFMWLVLFSREEIILRNQEELIHEVSPLVFLEHGTCLIIIQPYNI